eukprot:scaffold3052_cov389-Prasinococcus_capsulatus_cf.AAC.14
MESRSVPPLGEGGPGRILLYPAGCPRAHRGVALTRSSRRRMGRARRARDTPPRPAPTGTHVAWAACAPHVSGRRPAPTAGCVGLRGWWWRCRPSQGVDVLPV